MNELTVSTTRLFLGIAIPNTWHEPFQHVQNTVSPMVQSKLTWIVPQNLHITIQFFGDIRTSFVPELCTRLAQIHFMPFTISSGDIQCMPARGNPKFFVLHLKKGCDECMQLTQSVRECCQKLGMVLDSRLYTPYITLARMKTCVETDCWKDARMTVKTLQWPEYRTEGATLWKSLLLSTGPEHTPLAQFPAHNA